MRSIEARFKKVQVRNFIKSSYDCFAEAISGQKFSREVIHRWFMKLVNKDDYAKREKKELLLYLESL
ncbi:MAG: hypothetical protein WAV46_01765 [Candidatus Moraniibacteriota bacterium]